MEEIFGLVREELQRVGLLRAMPAGIVLTGGSSLLEGMPELAEEVFELPARRGVPENVGGLQEVVGSPMYATGVGLAIFGSAASQPLPGSGPRNIFAR
jgi:cell division protein FtsA